MSELTVTVVPDVAELLPELSIPNVCVVYVAVTVPDALTVKVFVCRVWLKPPVELQRYLVVDGDPEEAIGLAKL